MAPAHSVLERPSPAAKRGGNRWVDIYRSKLISIEEAVEKIGSDQDVIVAQCASEPQGCMSQFHRIKDRVENVRVFSVLTLKPYDFYMKPEMKGPYLILSKRVNSQRGGMRTMRRSRSSRKH